MTARELNPGQPQSGLQVRGTSPAAQVRRVRLPGFVAVSLCLGAALAAQLVIDRRVFVSERLSGEGLWVPLAASLYTLAAALWVLRFGGEAVEATSTVTTVDSPHAVVGQGLWISLGLTAVALVLGVLAFPRFAGNRFSRDGTILWGLGLLLMGLAAWLLGKPSGWRANTARVVSWADRQGLRLSWYQVGLLLAMAVGAFYRLFRINVIPLEMGPDLPRNYEHIQQILAGKYPIFFTAHPGREPLFFYLAAPFCRLFGLNHTNIKVVASLIGLAVLPAVYLVGRELCDREVGLAAALFLGISRWHIILGRMGYRSSLVPLLICLTWYFLLRGLKSGWTWFFALSGLFLGLGMYTYNAFMAAPLVVLGALLAEFLVGRGRRLLGRWREVLVLFIVALYVYIPLGRYAMEEPAMYGYRVATRVTSLEQGLPTRVLPVFFSNLGRALLMFNVQGDAVFASNVPFQRQLGFLTSVLFVLGVVYVVWRWRQSYNATVLIFGMGMLLPSVLALAFPHEVPSANRAIGAVPAAALLPAMALVLLRRKLAVLLPVHPSQVSSLPLPSGDRTLLAERGRLTWALRSLLIVVAVVALGIETWSVYPFYFQDYVRHLPALNYSISLQMARAIDAFADDGQSYIMIMPHWYDGNAVRAQLRRTTFSWSNELERLDPDKPPLAGPPGRYMVLVHPDDQATLQTLYRSFPRGVALVNLDNTGNIAFISFYGER